jgi:hypothetical protein
LRVSSGFDVECSGFGEYRSMFFLSSPSEDALLIVWGLEFRVQGSGFRVQGLGFQGWGSGLRAEGSGFRVQGLEFRV